MTGANLRDGFVRYPVEWLVSLIQHLTATYPLAQMSELEALGQIWAVDSSHWPIVRKLGWLRSEKVKGVRLHLGLSLNTTATVSTAKSQRQLSSGAKHFWQALVIGRIIFPTNKKDE